MNAEIVNKIKKLRIEKGYSHTDMAEKLNITRSAYQRLEAGETYSWAKYLDDLMAILEISPKDFFNDIGKHIIYQQNRDNSVGYVTETLYQENKETTAKLIDSYEARIKEQAEQILFLQGLIKKDL
ncbi:MAG: helix-turn-helix transcriptional regulator [Bergeyella zoohelcum]|nr:helix-turn-helix transcriptional regulator [Bergeyella zoohelcum]